MTEIGLDTQVRCDLCGWTGLAERCELRSIDEGQRMIPVCPACCASEVIPIITDDTQ